jgi:uncharacterized membrane protein HdeD (DUF308 family)
MRDPLNVIRRSLMATGIGILSAGLCCMFAPAWMAVPLEWLIGGAMFLTGTVGLGHLIAGLMTLLFGRNRKPATAISDSVDSLVQTSSTNVAKRSPFWGVVILQVVVGLVMLTSPEALRPYWALLLLLGIAIEGSLILWVSMHFSSLATKIGMWLNGLTSIVVFVVVILNWNQVAVGYWIGGLLGAKLVLLGWTLLGIGLRASDADLSFAYVGEGKFHDVPQVGSIYAVYYGPAFHCGISVGDGQIVDYLSDGVVRLISWEEFLLGRRALEWNYPDVPAGDAAAISSFATALAGKYNKYDAFRFNCENLAIYCRSLGQTTHSSFSQAAVGVEIVKRRPILGTLLQMINRAASWFLYGAGGPFGKKVGFAMIRVARVVTDWVIVRPLRMNGEYQQPAEVYMPSFEDREIAVKR